MLKAEVLWEQNARCSNSPQSPPFWVRLINHIYPCSRLCFLLLFWVFILGITLEFLLACRQAYDSATGKMGFYKGEGVSTTWQINIPLNVLSGMMKYQKYYLKHVIPAILAGPKSRIKDLLCFCTWLWGHLSSAVQAQPLGMGAEHRGKSTHALEPS